MDMETIQQLINSGMAWRLEGSLGRACMDAINRGDVMCGTEARRDYWGNVVPSRYDVKAGTKGSFDFVEAQHGMEYAQGMADVGDEPPTVDQLLGD